MPAASSSRRVSPTTRRWRPVARSCIKTSATAVIPTAEQATILRGQRKAYLRLAMEDFRQERRVAVAEMDAMIRALSDDEMAALVEFYASPRQHSH